LRSAEHCCYRAEKAEEEVAELVKKSQQLEVDLDQAKEQLLTTTQQLEEKVSCNCSPPNSSWRWTWTKLRSSCSQLHNSWRRR
jgi:hypothetical protein